MLGGIAFLRFGLSYTCNPDVHAAKQTLPASTLPEIKIKILGFHGLFSDGREINAITCKKKAAFNYQPRLYNIHDSVYGSMLCEQTIYLCDTHRESTRTLLTAGIHLHF